LQLPVPPGAHEPTPHVEHPDAPADDTVPGAQLVQLPYVVPDQVPAGQVEHPPELGGLYVPGEHVAGQLLTELATQ
jgi:hypothetical protein